MQIAELFVHTQSHKEQLFETADFIAKMEPYGLRFIPAMAVHNDAPNTGVRHH